MYYANNVHYVMVSICNEDQTVSFDESAFENVIPTSVRKILPVAEVIRYMALSAQSLILNSADWSRSCKQDVATQQGALIPSSIHIPYTYIVTILNSYIYIHIYIYIYILLWFSKPRSTLFHNQYPSFSKVCFTSVPQSYHWKTGCCDACQQRHTLHCRLARIWQLYRISWHKPRKVHISMASSNWRYWRYCGLTLRYRYE